MKTLSALLAFCAGHASVNDEFPAQRSVTRSFDDFFYLRLNKMLRRHIKILDAIALIMTLL